MSMEPDDFILLPAECVRAAQPFAFDFGGSVIKIAYKIEDEEADEDNMCRVYLSSFARQDLPKALAFIKEKVLKEHTEEAKVRDTYKFTGVGTHQYADTIEKELGIKVTNLWEMECFKLSSSYLLKTQTDEQLFFPPLATRDEKVEQTLRGYFKLAERMKHVSASACSFGPYKRWPCLIGVLGSAFVFHGFLENGETTESFFVPRGGRSFLGLGSILTGSKSFEELMALAEAGNDHSVNIYVNEMLKDAKTNKGSSGDEDDMYSSMDIEFCTFSWGWGVNKEIKDFKREDLAKTLLENLCRDTIDMCLMAARQLQLTNIILVGSFPRIPFVRKCLEQNFVMKKGVLEHDPATEAHNVTLKTLRAGSHLGALGAMLHGVAMVEKESRQEAH